MIRKNLVKWCVLGTACGWITLPAHAAEVLVSVRGNVHGIFAPTGPDLIGAYGNDYDDFINSQGPGDVPWQIGDLVEVTMTYRCDAIDMSALVDLGAYTGGVVDVELDSLVDGSFAEVYGAPQEWPEGVMSVGNLRINNDDDLGEDSFVMDATRLIAPYEGFGDFQESKIRVLHRDYSGKAFDSVELPKKLKANSFDIGQISIFYTRNHGYEYPYSPLEWDANVRVDTDDIEVTGKCK